MEFRLTYEGPLKTATKNDPRAGHKHEIRQKLHRQLQRLWEITPHLREARAVNPDHGNVIVPFASRAQWLAQQFQRGAYEFVPLVTKELSLLCGISILFLRPDPPGMLIRSGDLDNRLKTLFDALRMPANKGELGPYDTPRDGEAPFYCLLEDDRLITKVSVETDSLLEPISETPNPTDVRLVLTVTLRRVVRNWTNGPFE
jgi:hypothetical protein